MADKRPALGRGLSALIPDAPAARPSSERALDVDIDLLRPNKFQPRTHMDDGRIEELSRSIRSNGVIQPIVVRKAEHGYEIVAGERRWRASQRAGLLKVPVVVRDIPDDRLLAAALIENIQREDLNPIEEAHAYRRLGDEFGLTQEQIAESVGKDRSSVANYMRLLRLPDGDPRSRRRPGADHGPRPRAPRACRTEAASCASAARSCRRGCRCARPKRWSSGPSLPPPDKAEAAEGRPHPRRRGDGCASLSAPASASSARARAGASKSTSATRTSCIGSTSS